MKCTDLHTNMLVMNSINLWFMTALHGACHAGGTGNHHVWHNYGCGM